MNEELEKYKKHVEERLNALIPVFARAALGDFSSEVDIPDDDEFAELYMGIHIMLDVIRDQTETLERFNAEPEDKVNEQTAKLQERNDLLRAILANIGEGIAVIDTSGTPLLINPAAERILGRNVEARKEGGRIVYDIYKPDRRTPYLPDELPYKRALLGESVFGEEMFVKSPCIPEGVYLSTYAVPLRNGEGAIIGAVLVFRDISNFKAQETELRSYTSQLERRVDERAKELSAVLSSIGDGVIAAGSDERILYLNTTAENILGQSGHDAVGKPVNEVLVAYDEKGEQVAIGERLFDRALKSGETVKGKYYYKKADGTRFLASITASPIDSDGTVIGVVNSFRDMSQEEEIDRAKNELVSLVSHQLRTPPTGIKWYAGMLLAEEAGELTEAQRVYLDEIIYNNQRMVEIVNAMLDVSRLDLGRVIVEPKETEVGILAESVFKELILEITEKKIAIERHYGKDVPKVITDPSLLRIVLQNLIYNAVKYTPEGGRVALTLSVAEGELRIEVKDTGIGIPEDASPNIFQKLFRADNAQSIDPGGTGLGLYIVKRIIDELGGTISFTSELGKGTTFSLRIPATKPSEGKERMKYNPLEHGTR